MNEHAMDAPYRPAALDNGQQGLIGKGVDRYEGPLKVSGAAHYAFEDAPDGTLYAHIAGATIGAGKVLSVDASAAENMAGVVKVFVGHPDFPSSGGNSREEMPGWTDAIDHFGQPVALIVAESLEIARDAARAIDVRYETRAGRFDPAEQPVVADHGIGFLPNIVKGDADAAIADAGIRFDQTYTTPPHFPAALEPHATIAWWDGDDLIVRASLQIVGAARELPTAVVANEIEMVTQQRFGH